MKLSTCSISFFILLQERFQAVSRDLTFMICTENKITCTNTSVKLFIIWEQLCPTPPPQSSIASKFDNCNSTIFSILNLLSESIKILFSDNGINNQFERLIIPINILFFIDNPSCSILLGLTITIWAPPTIFELLCHCFKE